MRATKIGSGGTAALLLLFAVVASVSSSASSSNWCGCPSVRVIVVVLTVPSLPAMEEEAIYFV